MSAPAMNPDRRPSPPALAGGKPRYPGAGGPTPRAAVPSS